MNIAYLDASAGMSGDMLLAAWLDLGLPKTLLSRTLKQMGIPAVWKTQLVHREGLTAARLALAIPPTVTVPAKAGELIAFAKALPLSRSLSKKLQSVLEVLAKAEGAVHRVPWQSTTFHQLADPDTLVDIMGTCLALEYFGVQKLFVSPIPLGAWHRHGRHKPVFAPGPAAKKLLEPFDVRLRREHFEWTTPTAAALIRCFGSPEPAPAFRLNRLGHAVGTRQAPVGPTVLRLMVGEVA